eukprot:964562-Pelagomonas_calceolata.AAC.1
MQKPWVSSGRVGAMHENLHMLRDDELAKPCSIKNSCVEDPHLCPQPVIGGRQHVEARSAAAVAAGATAACKRLQFTHPGPQQGVLPLHNQHAFNFV